MNTVLKKIAAVLLACCLMTAMIPTCLSSAENVPLTLDELMAKFPDGKYWNHMGNPGASNDKNNQDGYTSTPCEKHGVVGTDQQTCNGFQPGDTQLSWQCMGFAQKLGYDATGYNPRLNANGWMKYTSVSALDNLKPGDIVRYAHDTHSIYVTAIVGDTVVYADCNRDGHCVITWGREVTLAKLKESFTYLRSAPFSLDGGVVSADCLCAEEYAGDYLCTTTDTPLNVRGGHGTSYDIVGRIPCGAVVKVSKASGNGGSDWAHVEYGDVSGYASMAYLQKTHVHSFENITEDEHPHRIYQNCTDCGVWVDTGRTKTQKDCYDCCIDDFNNTESIGMFIGNTAALTIPLSSVMTETAVCEVYYDDTMVDVTMDGDEFAFRGLQMGESTVFVTVYADEYSYEVLCEKMITVKVADPTAYEAGDVTRDGKININDAVQLYYHVNGRVTLDPEALLFADVAQPTDAITIADAVTLYFSVNGKY